VIDESAAVQPRDQSFADNVDVVEESGRHNVPWPSDRRSVSPTVEMATTVTFVALLLAVLAVWRARRRAPA
jgi:hypothetical protein